MKADISLQDYWDKNLDMQNIGETIEAERIDIEREIDFWMTPDQEWVYKKLGDVQGKRVLDLGGGLSVNCIILAGRGAEVVVADMSLERLRLLKKIIARTGRSEKIHLVCTIAESLALASASFNSVLTKSVLIHTELPVVVMEIARILKPGAEAFFVEPTTSNPGVNFYRRFFAPKEWQHITRYFSGESIETIRQTFARIEISKFYLLSFFAFFWQFALRSVFFFKLSLRILSAADKALRVLIPGLNNYCWFYVIQAKK